MRWGSGRRGNLRWSLTWALILVLVVAVIKPLRNNILYPWWPSLWRPIGSYHLIDRHLRDLFFPMDREPFAGDCGQVQQRIRQLQIMERARELNATFHIYQQEAWDKAVADMQSKHPVDEDTLQKLDYFRPALDERDQRQLMLNIYLITTLLDAFNITYIVAEGTLIGAARHGGIIPWDDDGDIMFKAEQWQLAKEVLSCVPGYGLKIKSDFLWKFYSLDSELWKDEKVVRFPYVDLFPYVEDDEYLWPLVIWMKDRLLWPVEFIWPLWKAPFENFYVKVPPARHMSMLLKPQFGDINVCESRLFRRREKKMMPRTEVVQVPCSILKRLYPTMKLETENG